MPHKKSGRKRKIVYHFCASQSESDLIHKRMVTVGIINRATYLRCMAIKGYHINIDLAIVRELTSQLGRYTNNLNQLCRRAEEVQSPYAADLRKLLQRNDALWIAVRKILEGLAKIK